MVGKGNDNDEYLDEVMYKRLKQSRDLHLERMFETRSEAWERVGLAVNVSQQAVRKARRQAAIFVPLSSRTAAPTTTSSHRLARKARVLIAAIISSSLDSPMFPFCSSLSRAAVYYFPYPSAAMTWRGKSDCEFQRFSSASAVVASMVRTMFSATRAI